MLGATTWKFIAAWVNECFFIANRYHVSELIPAWQTSSIYFHLKCANATNDKFFCKGIFFWLRPILQFSLVSLSHPKLSKLNAQIATCLDCRSGWNCQCNRIAIDVKKNMQSIFILVNNFLLFELLSIANKTGNGAEQFTSLENNWLRKNFSSHELDYFLCWSKQNFHLL